MNWFLIVSRAYRQQVPGYDNEGIKIFVVKGKITEEEYEEITGIPYTPPVEG